MIFAFTSTACPLVFVVINLLPKRACFGSTGLAVIGSGFSLLCMVGLEDDFTPSWGTSIFAVQIMAFKTQVRKSSLSQDLWWWAPVTPNPRCPFGLSDAHPTCCFSFLSRTDFLTCGLLLCGPSPRFRVSAGGRALRMGVTPSILSRNFMW